MSSSPWTIHNNRTLVTLADLTTEEALTVLRAEQPGDLQYWFAWREGMVSWNPVVTVVELDLNAPGVKQLAAPAPVMQLESKSQTPDVDSDFEIYWMNEGDTGLEKASFTSQQKIQSVEQKANPSVAAAPSKAAKAVVEKDRRKYPRFDIRLKVVIQNDNITFRTYSRNASLGGLALEVAIPPILMGQSCLIHLTDTVSNETIKLPGRIVPNREQTRYFSFFRASAESIAKLQKWLERFSETETKAS